MPLDPAQPHPVMCLTQDGLPFSHEAQAQRLCAAGARWIQLRMKQAPRDAWTATARTIVALCRAHGAVCIINDDVEIAVASDAHGVHLGKLDLDWPEARRRLGPEKILGGTVNQVADATRAVAAGCLDYVGVGPWRFTTNKKNLAPVLGATGVANVIASLAGLPAWVIGGIEANDLPAVHATGANGAAVSSALFRHGQIEENYRALLAAWPAPANALHS
jgi:thiamine-phosphate pyrophosphorylase